MKCQLLPGGVILCRSRGQTQRCKAHGAKAIRLCDWRIGKNKTCDEPLCANCTYSPAKDKDLCPAHKAMWDKHPRNK